MRWKVFFMTGFYAGYSPVAPGTAGSLVGMAVFFLAYLVAGPLVWIVNLVILALVIVPALRICDDGETVFGRKDPPQVVIDEMIGYWIAVLFHSFTPGTALLAFVLFRIMDILKPFPANRLQDLRGGAGIVADDCVAGIYANLAMTLIVIVLQRFAITI